MRRAQKKQAEDFVALLGQAHNEIRKATERKDIPLAADLLEQCQQGAIELGNLIEKSEGTEVPTISLLESYCELTYLIHEEIMQGQYVDGKIIHKKLKKSLDLIEKSVEEDIKVRIEVVFLPYKASMWDSLESVWMAADADECCDAYVIPIPYYDKGPDGSFRELHYEGTQYPEYVPVTWYKEYDFAKHRPDMIFIHNPYDDWNYVTSVPPFFYSRNLKQFTDLLVYIPYYSLAGNMSEGQLKCPAYYYADYIIIQAEKYRKFFDPDLSAEKILALGSPKFDRVIRMCNNPPTPPGEWKEKLTGKKVYFYNTSIGGMLGNTQAFLKKMEYVFRCFQKRDDVCLIWRPHPLLESTFESMRKSLYPIYVNLKNSFINNKIGIYDNTPDISSTVALCDAYIGDSGTSVTSLFGVTGKPMFILNNWICSEPEEGDWRGEIIKGFFNDGFDDWMITQGDKLYHASGDDYQYKYYCDLAEYGRGYYYLRAIEADGKLYVCPANAQDILVVSGGKIQKRITLERYLERDGAFVAAYCIGHYLFLVPGHYPAIVRLDITNDQISYIRGYHDICFSFTEGEWRAGGSCVWKNHLMIASPIDNRVLIIDSRTGKAEVLWIKGNYSGGYLFAVPDKTEICLLPYRGSTITCWNPQNGQVREYCDLPKNFQCKSKPGGYLCEEKPFSFAAFCKQKIIVSPYWGNMFLTVDRTTGDITEWKPPFPVPDKEKNGYFMVETVGNFIRRTDTLGEWTYRYFSAIDRKVYDINLETECYKEVEIEFDRKELEKQEAGFCEISEWLQYACEENAFNSIDRFLEDNIAGNAFDKNKQIFSYRKNIANYDGTSGEKIYCTLREKL